MRESLQARRRRRSFGRSGEFREPVEIDEEMALDERMMEQEL